MGSWVGFSGQGAPSSPPGSSVMWESHPIGFQNPQRNSLGLFSLELGGVTSHLPVKNWFGWELGWVPLDPGIVLGHFLQHWGLRAGRDPLDFGFWGCY